uniref:Uncharacterized protein n=1 Tax=Mycena chlorophos TaxID=658473 RepID=A0ABQ0LWY3_MYCCL|nr:predicted protein [Mycena chlorophos]
MRFLTGGKCVSGRQGAVRGVLWRRIKRGRLSGTGRGGSAKAGAPSRLATRRGQGMVAPIPLRDSAEKQHEYGRTPDNREAPSVRLAEPVDEQKPHNAHSQRKTRQKRKGPSIRRRLRDIEQRSAEWTVQGSSVRDLSFRAVGAKAVE